MKIKSEKNTAKSVNKIVMKTINEMTWEEILLLASTPIPRTEVIKKMIAKK